MAFTDWGVKPKRSDCEILPDSAGTQKRRKGGREGPREPGMG